LRRMMSEYHDQDHVDDLEEALRRRREVDEE
jgi:hypothetical protein